MYKPPENSNRVKSIRSKFENVDFEEKKTAIKNGVKKQMSGGINGEVNDKNNKLSRQLSDPQKHKNNNIKRTPAFRLDKSALHPITPQNITLNNRNKQMNSALNNCDKIKDEKKTDIMNNSNLNLGLNKPILVKSKTSHDFIYLRSKFDKKLNFNENENNDRNQRIITDNSKNNNNNKVDLSQLYTEPIPKILRNNNNHKIKEESDEYPSEIHKTQTLKLIKYDDTTIGLTDTLKSALQRPLPKGPAPQKPPRTFEHSKLTPATKNTSFLYMTEKPEQHTNNTIDNKENKTTTTIDKISQSPNNTSSKKDPRYMLNKLENALRNNTIKSKTLTPPNTITKKRDFLLDDTTNDFLNITTNTNTFNQKRHELPKTPDYYSTNCSNSLNCLQGLTTNYEKIKEPNSSFFVDRKFDEPVYDEPYHYSSGSDTKKNGDKCVENRNSLYYMSTLLLGNEDCAATNNSLKQCENGLKHLENKQQMATSENSSLSSFTSDSAASTPLEDTKTMEKSLKIKNIIDKFETKSITQTQQISGCDKSVEFISSPNRVEDLKVSLQRTLDRCFANEMKENNNSNSDSEDRECKVSVDKIISKFQTYVKTMPKYKCLKKTKESERLFYCCLIVEWNLEAPQIKFKFPSIVEIPQKIEDLCFPEAANGPLDTSNYAQCYSLVITNDKGERTFGYCRRVIPEGSTNCLPLAYCILSKHRAPRFYKKILIELESRHGLPDKLRDKLISEFYYNKFPKPGESIKINLACFQDDYIHRSISNSNNNIFNNNENDLDLKSYVIVNGNGQYGTLNKVKKNHENIITCGGDNIFRDDKSELTLTLHHDSRYEGADLKVLHQLPNHILLKVFASLLLERKVILISCVISKLSCCVDALQSIIYPFSWPHTFIPILPKCLWDVVESPTPVVCGVLSVEVVNEFTIEHGIVIDLDERCILIKEGDEDNILSNSMKKAWEQGIHIANSIPPDDYVHSVYLSDAYIKVFIVCLKNYKNFIVDGDFQKDAFIKNGKTKGIRRFLKWFTETTMFSSFIETAINNPECLNLFNQKMEMYGSEDSNLILNKLLEWKR